MGSPTPILVSIALMAIAAAIFAVIASHGMRSKLRALTILTLAWDVAVRSILTRRSRLLALGAMLTFGTALQVYFLNAQGYDQTTLMVCSIIWQAVMAIVIAVVAIPIHLFVAQIVLAPRRTYGQQAVEVAYPGNYRGVQLRAALLGCGIWVLSYALGVISKALIVSAPQPFQVTVYYVAAFATFIAMALFSLVRPALSFGSPSPVRDGVRLALRNSAALYLLNFLLVGAQLFAQFMFMFLPLAFLRGGDAAIASSILYLVFSAFQIVAMEAATNIFFAQANRLSPRVLDGNSASGVPFGAHGRKAYANQEF